MHATLENLIALCGETELVQLTDRADPPTDAIDVPVVEAALAGASALADGYVGKQYAVPLAQTPPLLVDLVCDIARYRLYKTAATEQVTKRYDDAIKTLKDIGNGLIKLPIADAPAGAAEPAGRDDVMVIQSEERLFSRSRMAGL